MKHRLLQACFLLFFALLAAPLGAQNTPVKVDVNLLQPSVYPNDLAEPGAAIVTITLLDNRPSYRGILNLTLSNNSGQSVTTPLTAELEVNLIIGVPIVLTGSRLAPFVRLLGADAGAGLTDNGIVLAEGEQQLCALVFDPLFLGQPISNQDLNCSFGFAELHEPPTPISPTDEEVAIDPLQDAVNFIWAPNYFAGPVINYLTIWDVPREWAGVTPDIIINSLEPIRQPLRVNELNALNKLWTTADADLIPGHRYLYQIQATDPTGRIRFRNNGYSRPVFFEYTYPTPSTTDQLCYAPAELALTGNNGNYQLTWAGFDLDSVNHTVSVVTLPERRFVLLSELTTTPTFPTRQLVNGGPQASFSYNIDVDLDTTNRQAYLVTLCTVCALTGEEFCQEVVLGTPGEAGPEDGCPTEDDVLAGVTVSALLPDQILVDWSGAFPGTDPNGWSASINVAREELAPGTDLAPPTFPAPAAAPDDQSIMRETDQVQPTPSTTTFSGLNPDESYLITVCYACPGGSTVCANWTLDLNGNDDCLTSLNFTRPDSTDTTLDLAWTYTPGTVPASDSFQLIWQVSDRSYPEQMATVAYADGRFTIEDRLPGQTYTLRVCAECTPGQPVCRELVPFGGCVAAYTPELVDLDFKRALIGWNVLETPAENTEMRYAMRSFENWNAVTIGQFDYFDPTAFPFPETQLAETPKLQPQLVYLAQLRNQCHDTLWSAWSEPVAFSTGCAVVDTLSARNITDSSALVFAMPVATAAYYQYSYRLEGANEWTVVDELENPSLPLTGLLAETTYEVKMRFWCTLGVWSNETEIRTFRTLPPCGEPQNALVYARESTAAGLHWEPSENAQKTILRYKKASSFIGQWQVVSNLADSVWLAELRGGATYRYRLRSDCGVNLSTWTEVDTFTLLCAPPAEILVSNITYESALVNIAGLSPSAGEHEYNYRRLGDTLWQVILANGAQALLEELDDLSTYEVRVRTRCGTGQFSVWSDTLQFDVPVKCLVPENLGVLALTSNSAVIRWDETGTVAAWEIRFYDPTIIVAAQQQTAATVGRDGGDAPEGNMPGPGSGTLPPQSGNPGSTSPASPPNPYANWQVMTTSDPEKFFSGLRQNTAYKVVVRAECPTFGWTEYSEVLEFRTLCPSVAPDELAATEMLETQARLEWSRLPFCLEEYRVTVESLLPIVGGNTQATINQIPQREPRGGGLNPFGRSTPGTAVGAPSIFRDSVTTTEESYLFTGLQANTEYRFRVRGKIRQSLYAPPSPGYLTMADWELLGAATSAPLRAGAGAGEITGGAGWGPYSEWLTFRTDHCAQPYDFVENTIDRSTMEISWTPSNGINTYEVKYKLAEDLGSSWAYINVTEPVVILENLLTNAIYDYQVTELCQSGEAFMPSPQDTFIMRKPSLNNGLYACGLETDVDLSNEVPLAELLEDDTIRAFDFPVVIVEANGSNGTFSGVGEIRVPYFGKAKMQFEFDNIFINDDYQMVGGFMEATGFGIEVLPPWADSLLGNIITGLEMLDSMYAGQQVEQLDSLMNCCSGYLPPALQDTISAILDCYQQNPDPVAAGCQGRLDALMVYINENLDSIVTALDTQIVVSLTVDIIRAAMVELSDEHLSILPSKQSAYATARSTLESTYPTLPIDPGMPDYLSESQVLDPGSGGNSTLNQFGESAGSVQTAALDLTLEDMFVNTEAKVPTLLDLKNFSLTLRTGDTDVFTPIHDEVRTIWYSPESGPDFDRRPLISQAKVLLIDKYTFLVNE